MVVGLRSTFLSLVFLSVLNYASADVPHVKAVVGKQPIQEVFRSAINAFLSKYKNLNFSIPAGSLSQNISFEPPINPNVDILTKEFFNIDLANPFPVYIEYGSPKLTATLGENDLHVKIRPDRPDRFKLDVAIIIRNPLVELDKLNVCTYRDCFTGLYAKFSDLKVGLMPKSAPIVVNAKFYLNIREKKSINQGFELNHKEITVQYRKMSHNLDKKNGPKIFINKPKLETPKLQFGPGNIDLSVTSEDLINEIENRKSYLAKEVLVQLSDRLPKEAQAIINSAISDQALPLHYRQEIEIADIKYQSTYFPIYPTIQVDNLRNEIVILEPDYLQPDSASIETNQPKPEAKKVVAKKIELPSDCYNPENESDSEDESAPEDQDTGDNTNGVLTSEQRMANAITFFLRQANVGFGIKTLDINPESLLRTLTVGFEPAIQLNWVNILPPQTLGNSTLSRPLQSNNISCISSRGPYGISVSEPFINTLLVQLKRQGLLDTMFSILNPINGLSLAKDGIKVHIHQNRVYIIANIKIKLHKLDNWFARNLGSFYEGLVGSTKGTLVVPLELPIALELQRYKGVQFLKIKPLSPIKPGIPGHAQERLRSPHLANTFGYPSNIMDSSGLIYNNVIKLIRSELEDNNFLLQRTTNGRKHMVSMCMPVKTLIEKIPLDLTPSRVDIENSGHISLCGKIDGIDVSEFLKK